ncbi:DUF7933 domain-containing protein [Saccharothrix sp. ST-888]|uniref:DUF7933 domain-containing protein n=1 Tax=Saccharothrix sp. ST-888 TaxID=1427391 RepID=UPI0005ECAC86|nr:DUF11 domain-containing protein [Saccharothrix sp. ST-888]KJK55119.1 hypothetical protein UK12_30580 [Saccharothrix sp. ST-888]
MKQTHCSTRRRLTALAAVAAVAAVPMVAFAAPAQAALSYPQLVVQKSHSPKTFEQGETGRYIVTVTNVGTVPTPGTITVADTLPTGLSLASPFPTSTGWTCITPSAKLLVCDTMAPVAAGASAPPLTIPVRVDRDAPAVAVNTIRAGDGDNVGGDTSADVTLISPTDHHRP